MMGYCYNLSINDLKSGPDKEIVLSRMLKSQVDFEEFEKDDSPFLAIH